MCVGVVPGEVGDVCSSCIEHDMVQKALLGHVGMQGEFEVLVVCVSNCLATCS